VGSPTNIKYKANTKISEQYCIARENPWALLVLDKLLLSFLFKIQNLLTFSIFGGVFLAIPIQKVN
jgi:hypothetical protein